MQGRNRLGLVAVAGAILLAAAMLAACGGTAATPEEEGDMGEMEEMEEDGDHAMAEGEMEEGDDHAMEEGDMEGDMEHSMDHLMVPEDAAAMENPMEATDESVSSGADLYAANCATCHGEGGMGDGPGAAALDPPPQDLTQGDVTNRTDGELFYIISNGIEETAMPAWESQLSEDERWDVINFIRSLQ